MNPNMTGNATQEPESRPRWLQVHNTECHNQCHRHIDGMPTRQRRGGAVLAAAPNRAAGPGACSAAHRLQWQISVPRPGTVQACAPPKQRLLCQQVQAFIRGNGVGKKVNAALEVNGTPNLLLQVGPAVNKLPCR